jgi:hypothetical protein
LNPLEESRRLWRRSRRRAIETSDGEKGKGIRVWGWGRERHGHAGVQDLTVESLPECKIRWRRRRRGKEIRVRRAPERLRLRLRGERERPNED